MPSHHLERAASALRREVSRIISQDLRDPDVSQLYVSTVELAPDKRSARVLVAPGEIRPGSDPDPLPLQALQRATPFIRKTLARRLRMRHVPELQFAYDYGGLHAQRIKSLLDRVKKRSGMGTAML